MLGFLGVAIGAFGAHGCGAGCHPRCWRSSKSACGTRCITCFALLIVAAAIGHFGPLRLLMIAGWAFIAGIAHLLGKPVRARADGHRRCFGAITPIGGLGFLDRLGVSGVLRSGAVTSMVSNAKARRRKARISAKNVSRAALICRNTASRPALFAQQPPARHAGRPEVGGHVGGLRPWAVSVRQSFRAARPEVRVSCARRRRRRSDLQAHRETRSLGRSLSHPARQYVWHAAGHLRRCSCRRRRRAAGTSSRVRIAPCTSAARHASTSHPAHPPTATRSISNCRLAR